MRRPAAKPRHRALYTASSILAALAMLAISTVAAFSGANWTLYEFMRLPNGFMQQQLSAHATADACLQRFEERARWFHEAPVVAARCVYISRAYPPIELLREPPDTADWPLR